LCISPRSGGSREVQRFSGGTPPKYGTIVICRTIPNTGA